ncbi:MAG: hypothetical protein CFE24_11250 [Flavobacterium sp. BFFFF2]|nr:MAG: hypothetical protein CFE24_11250 [Flavobacterium sp. BFFFF2]
MKKVILSLAVIAALTVVSCKQNENKTEGEAVDTTAVTPVEEAAPAADTTAADTTAAMPAEAPAAAPAAEPAKK